MRTDEKTIEKAGKTAMSRRGVSVPTRELLKKGLLKGSIFHHGRGKADADADEMRNLGGGYDEYDPNYAPDEEPLSRQYDTTVSNYVLNTIPPKIRDKVWTQLQHSVGNGNGFITVRGAGDKASLKGIEDFEDGIIMRGGTFQKFFTVEEIVEEAGKYFSDVEVVQGSNKSPGITIRVSNAEKVEEAEGDYLGLESNAEEDARNSAPTLSQDEVRALKQKMNSLPREKSSVRFIWNGQALNPVTGEVVSKGTNVMYHPVFWDMPKVVADEIGKQLGVRVDYQGDTSSDQSNERQNPKDTEYDNRPIGQRTSESVNETRRVYTARDLADANLDKVRSEFIKTYLKINSNIDEYTLYNVTRASDDVVHKLTKNLQNIGNKYITSDGLDPKAVRSINQKLEQSINEAHVLSVELSEMMLRSGLQSKPETYQGIKDVSILSEQECLDLEEIRSRAGLNDRKG